MPRLTQKVRIPSRNVNLTVKSDYPSFDIIVNGEKYETKAQDSERIFDEFITDRSLRTNRKVQNTNSLQRTIRDRLYKTAEGL